MANNGKYGERLFHQIMEYKGYEVKDVTDIPTYWSKDIDFIVLSHTTGKVKAFEVKWDERINQTRNLYLEIQNVKSKQWNGDGWWKHIEADYLAYGDARTHQFYMIDINELRKRVEQLPYRIGTCDNGGSVGLLVSLDDIADITMKL